MSENIKAGARHSAADSKLIQVIHDSALDLGAMPRQPAQPADAPLPVEVKPDASTKAGAADSDTFDSEALAFAGDAIKALGDGRVGGYLVRFGSPQEADSQGEYFDAETDFGPHVTSLVFYHHGFDKAFRRIVLDSAAKLSKDSYGIPIEAQLNMADPLQAQLYRMCELGKMGWSSGSASHLVERETVKGGAVRITKWPLGLDASITPTPADTRARALPIKGLQSVPFDEVLKAAGDAATNKASAGGDAVKTNVNTQSEAIKMPDTQNAQALEIAALKSSIDALAASFEGFAKATAAKAAAAPGFVVEGATLASVRVTDSEAPFKSKGDFFLAVKAAADGNLTAEQSNRLQANTKAAIKSTGLNEAVASEGGFLVAPEVASGILMRAYEVGSVLSRVDKAIVGPNTNAMTYNGLQETSRANGSRFGGVTSYWGIEGGTLTGSKPTFQQVNLKANKVHALVYATDEVIADVVALEDLINKVAPLELSFRTEDAFFNGTGVGMPLGVLAAPALVTVAAEGGQTADTINAANVTKMWGRMWSRSKLNSVWFVNQDATPQLFLLNSIATGAGQPLFVAPGGLPNAPMGTLFGRPIVEVEYCQTVGDVGDIVLADMSQYKVIDKGNIQQAASMHVAFLTDEMAYRFTYRVDGKPVWNSALTPKNGSNTVSPFIALAAR